MARKVSFDEKTHSFSAFVKFQTEEKVKKYLTLFQYNKESKHGDTKDFTYSLLVKIIDKKYKDDLEITESSKDYDTLQELYKDVKLQEYTLIVYSQLEIK